MKSLIKKTAVVSSQCVACGYCMSVCPKNAISIPNGIKAIINKEICIGCGICARSCPASVISIKEENINEK